MSLSPAVKPSSGLTSKSMQFLPQHSAIEEDSARAPPDSSPSEQNGVKGGMKGWGKL